MIGDPQEESAMKLGTIRLLVGDFPSAFQFWRDVMGLPVAYGPDSPDAVPGYAYFTPGETGLELLDRDSFADSLGEATIAAAPTGRESVLIFSVDDVDATYAELVGRGAKAVAGPIDRPEWQARTAHLSDPEGHLIEIYSKLEADETPTA
jgi:lactoylglutathione lyase